MRRSPDITPAEMSSVRSAPVGASETTSSAKRQTTPASASTSTPIRRSRYSACRRFCRAFRGAASGQTSSHSASRLQLRPGERPSTSARANTRSASGPRRPRGVSIIAVPIVRTCSIAPHRVSAVRSGRRGVARAGASDGNEAPRASAPRQRPRFRVSVGRHALTGKRRHEGTRPTTTSQGVGEA